MWKKCVVVLFIPLVTFVKNGDCLECYLCTGEVTNEDPCSNPKQHQASNEAVLMIPCDYSKAESTWNFAKQIHTNYSGIFKITPMMFVNNEKREMGCVTVLSKLGNANHIFRGCALKDVDICSGVKNVENEYLTNLKCDICDTDGCNSAEDVRINRSSRIFVFGLAAVFFLIIS